MNKEIGIILMSHGYYAQEAMKSAEMIVGLQKEYIIISVTEDKDLNEVIEELSCAYEKLKQKSSVVILTDIFGGTPCNACANLILKGIKVNVYTGFNLPILLTLLLNRSLEQVELSKLLKNSYSESFISLNEKLGR